MRNANHVQRYLDFWQHKIQGWFYQGDMLCFAFLSEIQEESGYRGDLCEVGVYHGKSLALLDLLRAQPEHVFGFDLFERAGQDVVRGTLIDVCGSDVGTTLVQKDSLECDHDFLKGILHAPLRFLHIDAGHEYQSALSDLRNFGTFVGPAGIIAVDDYYDRRFPGVCAATHTFLQSGEFQFVPFLLGHNKLYLCRPAFASHYLRHLIKKGPFQSNLGLEKMYDHPVLIAFAGRRAVHASEVERILGLWESQK